MDKISLNNSYDIDALKLVFEESKCLRKESSDHLIQNNDKIWDLKNILMILAGFYITFLTFVYSKESNLPDYDVMHIYPVILSFVFWAIALYFTFYGIFPKYSLFEPDPSGIRYTVKKDKKAALDDFILTYLSHYKETLIEIAKTSALRKKIIYFEIYSATEFVLSILIYFLGKGYIYAINMTSVIIALFFIVCYFNLDYDENEIINSLVNQLSKFDDILNKRDEE